MGVEFEVVVDVERVCCAQGDCGLYVVVLVLVGRYYYVEVVVVVVEVDEYKDVVAIWCGRVG